LRTYVSKKQTFQEQFVHYLRDTAQFKNTVAVDSTSNAMTDQELVGFVSGKFN